MRTTRLPFLIFLPALLLTLPLSGQNKKDKKKDDKPVLRVAGAVSFRTTLQHPMTRKFASRNHLELRLYSGGSETGITAVSDRHADVAISSRPLKPEEREKGLVDTLLAYDAIAVVVHKSNPMESITLKELEKIFRHKIKTWKKFGWQDAPIQVILPDTGSGLRTAFLDAVVKRDKIKIQPREELSTYGAIYAMMSDSLALSICSMTQAHYRHLKVLRVEGVLPTPETIADGSYPLRVPISLVTRAEPGPLAERFIEWVMRGPAWKLIADAYVPAPEEEEIQVAE